MALACPCVRACPGRASSAPFLSLQMRLQGQHLCHLKLPEQGARSVQRQRGRAVGAASRHAHAGMEALSCDTVSSGKSLAQRSPRERKGGTRSAQRARNVHAGPPAGARSLAHPDETWQARRADRYMDTGRGVHTTGKASAKAQQRHVTSRPRCSSPAVPRTAHTLRPTRTRSAQEAARTH